MTSSDLTSLMAHKLAEEIASSRLSPVDILDAYLKRIGALDQKLHAFVEVYEKEARAAAETAHKEIRAGRALSPFHGMPIALKDLIEIEGKIATAGSAIWKDRKSKTTATIVNRLLAQGFIVVGKTHTVEFACGGWGTNQRMGTPWNPWDAKNHRAPGGSSSGSAVAVASRLVPWAVGTDTGGSIRLPSSWCGLTGLKPTVGRISTHGIIPLSPTLDSVGPLARCVEDAVLLYQALCGADAHDPRTFAPAGVNVMDQLKRGIKGRRFARLQDDELKDVSASERSAYESSLDTLTSLGATVAPLTLPFKFSDLAALNGLIMRTEAYSLYANFVDDPKSLMDENVRDVMIFGRNILANDYLATLRKRDSMQQQFDSVIEDFDAFLTPTTLEPAKLLSEIDQNAAPAFYTRCANFLNLCAIAIPNGISEEGLPTSLQIIGKRFDEAGILSIAWAYQNATEWHTASPPAAQ